MIMIRWAPFAMAIKINGNLISFNHYKDSYFNAFLTQETPFIKHTYTYSYAKNKLSGFLHNSHKNAFVKWSIGRQFYHFFCFFSSSFLTIRLLNGRQSRIKLVIVVNYDAQPSRILNWIQIRISCKKKLL